MTLSAKTVGVGVACGKAILLGEHAVVYGVPAIAVGIDRGARATATPAERGRWSLRVKTWGVEVTERDAHDLGRALGALVQASPVAAPMAVEASVELPPGGGLGCSAALGVAVARAIDPLADADAIAERVAAWERVFHGNPSGVDAAVASRGGCVFFTKGAPMEPVHVAAPLTVCIGSSGASSSTATMVESVALLRTQRPDVVGKAFESIRSLVGHARTAIEEGDRSALGRLMDLNQIWLRDLFLSTPEIDRLCRVAREHGAYGAKLTGAGGGGCVVALVNGAHGARHVLDAWRVAGFEGFSARVAPAKSEVDAVEMEMELVESA